MFINLCPTECVMFIFCMSMFLLFRCNQWLINCNRTDLLEKSPKYVNSRCRLCEKHFEDDQFMNASKSRLIWRAIPTIFDTSDPPESEKRRKFKHSFLSAKRKRISTLDQSCSADHTYFAALDKSARTKRMKTDVPDPETHPELTVCDLSRNTTFGLIDTRNNTNIANLYEYSGHETTAFIAVNTTASDVAGSVDINNMTSYCDSSSVRAILRPTQGASITGTNVTFQNTSRDVTFLTDGNIFPNSGVVGEFNANTNVIMFYNTSIRDEAIQDNGCSTANMDFEDLSNTIVPGMKFQEELKDGTSEGSMVANSGVAVPLNTRLIAFCDSSSNDETLVTMQSMLPEMTGSVQHTTLGSQMYTTSADIPSAVDYATAAAGTICESSRSATVSSRKRKRRKVAASEMAAGSVDHTYATNVLQKSFQGEGDCSCESFSKEQGMMLVQVCSRLIYS